MVTVDSAAEVRVALQYRMAQPLASKGCLLRDLKLPYRAMAVEAECLYMGSRCRNLKTPPDHVISDHDRNCKFLHLSVSQLWCPDRHLDTSTGGRQLSFSWHFSRRWPLQ